MNLNKTFFTFSLSIFCFISSIASAQRTVAVARKHQSRVLSLADHTCTEEIEIYRETDPSARIGSFKVHNGQVAFEAGSYRPGGTEFLSRVYFYDLSSTSPPVRVDDGSAHRVSSLDIHDGGIAYITSEYGANRSEIRIHREPLENGVDQVSIDLPPATEGRNLRGAHDFASGSRYFFYVEYGVPYRVPAQLKVCELPGVPREQSWGCRAFSDRVTEGPIAWSQKAEPILWGNAYRMFQLLEFQNTVTGLNRHLISGPMGVRFIHLGESSQNFTLLDANEVFAVFVREEVRGGGNEERVFNQIVLGFPDERMQQFVQLTPWEVKEEFKFGVASISHGPSAFQSVDGRMKIAYIEQGPTVFLSKLKITYMDWSRSGVMPSFEVAQRVQRVEMDGDWIVYLKVVPTIGGEHKLLYAKRCWFN